MPALPPSFLVQATFPIKKLSAAPSKATPKFWDDLTPLPQLALLDHETSPLHIAIGWHADGLVIGIQVTGKALATQVFDDDLSGSDSVTICLDTRDMKAIHRAGRFCHRFRLVAVDLQGRAKPRVVQEPVPRARDDAPFHDLKTRAVSEVTDDGYRVLGVIPAANLNGYDPSESPRLGFFAQLHDIELGAVPWTGDVKLPSEADPSMWSTIELVSS